MNLHRTEPIRNALYRLSMIVLQPTVWPSTHSIHAGLIEQLREERAMAESYRESWKNAVAELTATRIRLGKAEAAAAKWQQAFNSLEKPITNHIEDCMDADDLDRAHAGVMKRFGPEKAA